MAKRFSSRNTKKTKIRLSPKNAMEVVRKEFIDSRNNIMKMIIDVKPHNPNSPTIEWNRQYEKE